MKGFIKENIIQILFVVLLGLVLILWGRVMVYTVQKEVFTQNITATQDRVRCANACGWEVDATSETETSFYLPQEWNEEGKAYNELQILSGFNLSPYLGQGATCYTFRVLNFPEQENTEAFLHLLVLNNQLIGGDCTVFLTDTVRLPLKRP